MRKRVAVIHPDLGIGGAEQMIINISLALQGAGHTVKIYTPHHDPSHCFQETVDGTLTVEVIGGLWPRAVWGRCIALCAYVRMLLTSLFVVMYAGSFDYIVVDQVSAILPVLRLSTAKLVFYCHFPDKYLCTDRKSGLKQSYRRVLDSLEGYGLTHADVVMVNSNFTKETVVKAFAGSKLKTLEVVYPCISTPHLQDSAPPTFLQGQPYFMSLNRYERKKDVEFALKCFAEVRSGALLIAGGYDSRLQENVLYKQELQSLCSNYKLTWADAKDWDAPQDQVEVYFAMNLTAGQRDCALQHAVAVLYTPENEHFGIIPLEAMVRGTPVIASQSGGPLETVKHNKTGFLLDKDPALWSKEMRRLIGDSSYRDQLGREGTQHVLQNFSLGSLQRKLAVHIN
jgi:alpha-1,3/alpha-1,6-mannosyltransferase